MQKSAFTDPPAGRSTGAKYRTYTSAREPALNATGERTVKAKPNRRPLLTLATILLVTSMTLGGRAIRVDDYLPQEGLGKVSAAAATRAIENAASQLQAGDALILPEQSAFDTVVLRQLPDDVQLLGGTGGKIMIEGLSKGLVIHGGEYALDTKTKNAVMEDAFLVHVKSDLSLTDVSNTYWIDHIGAVKVEGKMENCTGVWVRYNHESSSSQTASIHLSLKESGQNVKLLHLIEHNQMNTRPAVYVEDADGLVMANGSTESGGPYVLYTLKNCKNVHLAHRRFYHRQKRTGWGIEAPQFSLYLMGGEGNIIDNLVDIGNPQQGSMLCGDPKAQFWSTLFEEQTGKPPSPQGMFYFSHVTNAMPGLDKWSEPRLINEEIVCSYETAAGMVDLTNGEPMPEGHCLPTPPPMPKCDIPQPPTLLYKKAASFGAALIKAGADPTGTEFSDEAFAKVAQSGRTIEVGPGTYRLKHGIACPADFSGELKIVGAGPGRTILTGPGAAEVYREGFLKSDIAQRAVEIAAVGMTYDGEDKQNWARNSLGINEFYMNCEFKNYLKGAVLSSSGEPEQYRFISCKFINTGEYGIRLDTYCDKPLFYRCHFEGQTKGGIYCTRIVHFHGGIYQCTFKDIGGPGVAVMGGSMEKGYGPWVFTVDNCTFDECGSPTEAVVEFGPSWLGVLSHSTITTQSKAIKAGFRGCFAIIDNVTMNVQTVDNCAMYLGHQRWEKTAGVGGSRVTNTTVSGEIRFLDFEKFVTGQVYSDPGILNSNFYNAGQYSQHPWAYTYMFHNVSSSNYQTGYALLDDEGTVAVDLSAYETCTLNAAHSTPNVHNGAAITKASTRMYDIRGRLLNPEHIAPARRHGASGVILIREGTRVTRTLPGLRR